MPRAPIRIQRQRTKGWRMPAGVIYVGRPSLWGNPFDFRSSEHCWTALAYGCKGDPAGRREASVRAFRLWMSVGETRWAEFRHGKKAFRPSPTIELAAPPSIDPLRGHDLACWCAIGQSCHADVLLDLANA